MIKKYMKQVERLLRNDLLSFNFLHLINSYKPWLQSLNKNRSPLVDEVPWINFKALGKFKKILKKNPEHVTLHND